MADESNPVEDAPQVNFKVKTSSDGNHNITMSEAATVLDLKTKLAGDDFEKIPVERQRLIYSGRVMKNEDPLSTYKIKAGNTIHMVKSAASNTTNAAASSATIPGAGVPTNMAAGTANNPLAGLTGARYAGHVPLPGAEMFGADGGMGAPPSEDAMAQMLEDPNIQQTMNEALQNPAVVDMMINSIPGLRDNPQARQMLQSEEFRRMMTNPEAMRQAAQMQRLMRGTAGGASAFPAPGVTDNTPGAGGATGTPNASTPAANPFAMFGPPPGAGGANPFAALLGGQGAAPRAPGSASPPSGTDAAAANPFASLFGGAGVGAGAGAGASPFGLPSMTPEMMEQAMAMFGGGRGGDLFGGLGGGRGGSASPPPPADRRPPEEMYADQLRQLNDMGFFDFDRNVQALRRSGGSVQGAIEQLLS
ncbi:hypothetical protein HYALB_00011627 [Hymenoscyphus albidus]|uniref:Deubiquitination-protection protein dph1 n=1 Tax=Hymenoscyphus albidus TaxID=595503 RepID=A0A9N9LEW8_9HELO|nr:hypothetical protein HYALB_00011627 [Hymenoscyphus albidus]